tara:strand:- start:11691 stop:12275 length:585 start_codon:yes stop_codon:yes gene_type:complete
LVPQDTQEKQLEKFKKLLLGWNETHNLISKGETQNLEEHIADSLSVAHLLSKNILDLGSGNGFPGIPIAITNPQKKVFLVERKESKAAFLLNTCNQLGLMNTTVIKGDSSNLDPKDFPQPIDIVARAFGSSFEAIRAVNQFLKNPKNQLKLMKTSSTKDFEALPKEYVVEKINEIFLKGKDKGRILVTIRTKDK